MTTSELIHNFTAMIQNASRIHNFIEAAEADTGKQYIGAAVIETMPNGSKHRAVIMEISWCSSCGLSGNWLIYIAYSDENKIVPGAWVTREVLTLAGVE